MAGALDENSGIGLGAGNCWLGAGGLGAGLEARGQVLAARGLRVFLYLVDWLVGWIVG